MYPSFVTIAVVEWFENVGDYIGDSIIDGISHFFYSIVYEIAAGILSIIEIMDKLYAAFSGTAYVTYDGTKSFLINVFFNNTTINSIYWGMALIGVALCFVFTIIAVMRKSVDIGDKIRQPLGGILTSMFKSIVMILSMSALMTVVLYSTNVLMTQIEYVFKNGETLNQSAKIEYTNEQYAAMARALDTIGNYSLNPSFESRYNINSCFNEIRDDLSFLQETGVFDFQYDTSKDGESWQSVLQSIANAADVTSDLNPDVYNQAVTEAITNAVKQMETNAYFLPLKEYSRQYQTADSQYMNLDRVIFLVCTANAARNSSLNSQEMSLTDSLRGAYYYGQKSIYSYASVNADFDVTEISYMLLFFMAIMMGWDLIVIILNCVARIFNMLLLYLISPFVIATAPLDEGGKLKQWSTAFVVQCFGVMGTVISMRLLSTLLPIIMSSKLVMFDDNYMNTLGKVVLILGAIEVSKRASGMITGILADNAGWQSISAGDMSMAAEKGWGYSKWIAGGAWKVGTWPVRKLWKATKGDPKTGGGTAAGGAPGGPSGGSGGGGESLPQKTETNAQSDGAASDSLPSGESGAGASGAGASGADAQAGLPQRSGADSGGDRLLVIPRSRLEGQNPNPEPPGRQNAAGQAGGAGAAQALPNRQPPPGRNS